MRLRFTIRDLLWLTVVVAMAVAWWVDRDGLRKQSIEHEFKKVMEWVDQNPIPYSGPF